MRSPTGVTMNGTAVATAGSVTTGQPSRILHVCTRYAVGGSERRLRDLISALPDHEHDVVLGADSDLDLARRHLPGVGIVVEPMLRRSVSVWRDPVALVRLRRAIVEHAGDLVVTHQSKAGVLGRLAARAAGSPPVVHSLSMADFGPGYRRLESRVFRAVERSLARWTAAYAVVGADLASRFGRIGVPAEKLTVIRSAVPLPRATDDRTALRREVAAAYGLPPDRPWILSVGSLEERKCVLDLPILLQQVLLLDTGRTPFLVVAGDGPEEARLWALVRQVGLEDDCRLLGHVDDPGDLFLTSDVVVLISRAEGLPQVLVQAAAAGTPYVATDVDGAGELLELGAVGTVVDLGDAVGAAQRCCPTSKRRFAVPRRRSTCPRGTPPRCDASIVRWSPRSSRRGPRPPGGEAASWPSSVRTVPGSPPSAGHWPPASVAAGEVMHLYLGSGDGPASALRWPLTRLKRALLGENAAVDRRRAVREAAPRTMVVARSVWALTLAQEKRGEAPPSAPGGRPRRSGGV